MECNHPKWIEWKSYRTKEKKQRNYTQAGEIRTLTHLNAISGGNDETAILIIDQSMINQWQGLFPLKNYGTTKDNQRLGTSAARMEALRNW